MSLQEETKQDVSTTLPLHKVLPSVRKQLLAEFDLSKECLSFLENKLAHFKIPVHYWWVNRSLPRGATDKFDRIKIKELCLNNSWSDEDG